MCTVTIVSHRGGCTLMCNRDERETRLPAIGPRVHRAGPRQAVYPVDPESGGTWIGANDAALVIALLNRTSVTPPSGPAPTRSRGLIVPMLLRCANVSQALSAAFAINPASYDRFQLLAIAGNDVHVIESNGASLSFERTRSTTPLLFTSSSLGDGIVEGPRRHLFEEMVLGSTGSRLRAQRLFHDHQWSDRPEVSVRMARDGARTVSRTCVSVTATQVRLIYEPLGRRNRAA